MMAGLPGRRDSGPKPLLLHNAAAGGWRGGGAAPTGRLGAENVHRSTIPLQDYAVRRGGIQWRPQCRGRLRAQMRKMMMILV